MAGAKPLGESSVPDELAALVDEFVRLLDEGGPVDIDRFVDRAPGHLRAELRARCLDVSFLRKVMPGASRGRSLFSGPAVGEELGDFRLLEELGRGAMGIVYSARQHSLQRPVALKVLYPHLAQSARQVERFRREAKAAAKLKHAGIVPVFAVGEQNSVHYFAMELVDGRSLASELDGARDESSESSGAPSLGHRDGANYIGRVCEIAARVAEALDCAHSMGVIHRDVKPHNILLGKDGRPRLVDFGLAKDLDLASLSASGDIAGTPYYMSPEQALARRVSIDHRTDVFSLGVVLYEMLTLLRPFEGRTSQQVLYRLSFDEPTPIRRVNRAVPRDLETICSKAMEKSPERRYASAAEFAADLRRFLAHEAIVARPPSWIELGSRKLVRHRVATVASCAAVVSTFGVAWWQKQVKARESLGQEIELLAPVEHAADLASLPAETLHDALRQAGKLREQAMSARDAERLDALRERIHAVGEDWKRQGFELLARATPDRAADVDQALAREGSPTSAVIYWWIHQGSRELERARLLLPEDRELEQRLRALNGGVRVSVACEVDGATVSVQVIDTHTGARTSARVLGTTPLRDAQLEPGYYRFTVDAGERGFAELVRYVDLPGASYELRPTLRPTGGATTGMVLMRGGRFVFGNPKNTNVYKQREESVDDFWIDTTEVSNAQYRAFMRSTGRPPAKLWLDEHGADAYRAEWDDLPVTGVTWPDAVAYAEWAGKRLPTQFEWERAARGSEGRLYPWNDDSLDVRSRTNMGHPRAWSLEQYLAGVSSVESAPLGRTPEGLFHMLDNVSEWSESLDARLVQGVVQVQAGYPVILGGDWTDDPDDWSLCQRGTTHFDRYEATVGFRCAKSVAP